jgi:DNA-binding IclR family transcriptional regulator
MRAAQTQIDAYHAMPGRQLSAQKQMIVDLFAARTTMLTRRDIADRTNMAMSSVCGRVRELVDAEILTVRGKRECIETGVMVETVGLPVDTVASV